MLVAELQNPHPDPASLFALDSPKPLTSHKSFKREKSNISAKEILKPSKLRKDTKANSTTSVHSSTSSPPSSPTITKADSVSVLTHPSPSPALPTSSTSSPAGTPSLPRARAPAPPTIAPNTSFHSSLSRPPTTPSLDLDDIDATVVVDGDDDE